MEQRIYSIGIQNFESLRQDGYVYVDKTAIVHRRVTAVAITFSVAPSFRQGECIQ